MTPSCRLVALGLSVLVPAAVAADVPKPPDASRVRSLVRQMRSGTQRVKDPDAPKAEHERNLAAIKTVAEWLAYSVAQPPYNGEPLPREEKEKNLALASRTMESLFVDADEFCKLPISGGNQGKVAPEQLEYGAEFGKALATAVTVVLDNAARPIERINAVRMLSMAARLPAVGVIDPLLAVVNNSKASDAEKLYAFQGLRNLLEQTEVLDLTVHIPDLRRDAPKLGEIGRALTNYIMQKRTPRDDREKAVIEFVRRHAVEAMAQFKDGVLRKPNKELIYRPSWTLARIMEQDPSASPPFTIQEQVEAAIGFSHMKIDPDMNLDVGAYTLAKIVVTFATAANQDSQRAARDETLPVTHWRVAAARLSHGLATMREAARPLPKTRHPDTVVTLATVANFVLAKIEKDGPAAQTGPELQAVITWGTDNPPKAWAERKSAILYNDDPQSVLPFPSAPVLKTPNVKGAEPKKTPDPKAADPKKGTAPKNKGG